MFSFNAEQEETFDNKLADGEYPVMITEAEYAPANSNPQNHVLSLTLAITDDSSPYSGWKVYDRYNVQNINEMAQKIGRSDLKKLCMAIGMASFTDVRELIGYSLIIETKNREYQGKTFPNVVARNAPVNLQPEQFQQAPIQQQAPAPMQERATQGLTHGQQAPQPVGQPVQQQPVAQAPIQQAPIVAAPIVAPTVSQMEHQQPVGGQQQQMQNQQPMGAQPQQQPVQQAQNLDPIPF